MAIQVDWKVRKKLCFQVSVKHCSLCDGDTEYYCHPCRLDLCRQCMENHLYTDDHYVTIYRGKFTNRQIKENCKFHPKKVLNFYCDTCSIPICINCEEHENHTIQNILKTYNDLSRKHRSIIVAASLQCKNLQGENNSNVWISCKIANIRSKILLKARTINDFLDDLDRELKLTDTLLCCQPEEKIQQLHALEHKLEQLACKTAVQFLRFIKEKRVHKRQCRPSSNLLKYLSGIKIEKHEEQCTDDPNIVPALVFEFQLKGFNRLFHISLVTSSRIWVKCPTTFALIDIKSKKILKEITDSISGTEAGLCTVNKKQELIYINTNYEIIGYSEDSKSIRIEREEEQWIPQSVYCSPSNGDLFVAMWIPEEKQGKIEKYDNIEKLTKSIQYDKEGRTIYSCPSFITENKNGDIVVSDFEHGVVVTDCEGNYRFSYTGPPLKPRIQPAGICVDALSNILMCDIKTRTVQRIDENGVFLDYLLTHNSPGIQDRPISLEIDFHTNHLWVGSFETISVYNYINPVTVEVERSLSIESPLLRDLFNSIGTIIKRITDICPCANDICEVLAKEMDSLTIEVLLCRNVVNCTKYLPSWAFICMEFEVVYHNDELLVRDKTSKWDQLLYLKDRWPKLILVTSKCLSAAEAKLAVYRQYKDIIDTENFFIYHEYDDYDQISRFVAFQRLSSFYNTIGPYLQNTLDYQRQKIMNTIEVCKSLCQPTQQRELAKEWEKREIVKATDELKQYPSILKYILGRKNDRPCIKVFFREKDENATLFFQKQGNILSKDTMYEFVDIKEKSEEMWQEMMKIKKIESAACEVSSLLKHIIKDIVEKEEEKMYAKHSNLVGIGISNVLVRHESIIKTPCIVLYCLDKTLVPFGENPLPRYIKGYPCDIREDLVVFGSCDHCSTLNPGCNIGSKKSSKSGSAGFLVEQQNRYKGFLTAAHVVFDNVESIYRDNAGDFSNTILNGDILHPSNSMRKVGELHSCIFGNFISCGSDIAIVHTSRYSSPSEQVYLQVVDDDNLRFDSSVKVIKRGNVTHDTTGILWDKYFSVDIGFDKETRPSYTFKDIYRIADENRKDAKPFFEIGDSGSGVFVLSDDKHTLKPLGIAFARSQLYPVTFVCKIKHIMEDFQLAVCYNEPMDTS